MKKFFLIIAFSFGAVLFAENNTIAVPAPKMINVEAGNEWIPLFVQGVISANFQQYSGMKVIDRQNADMVKAEQRLSESAEFDEKNTITLGKMTSARLIVTGSITGKASSYALIFSITDAETGEAKTSASVPNCLFSALESGEAANRISYDLMTGYGIALSADVKVKLTEKTAAMNAETTAQASVAKGIAAEKVGSNIEALTYYIRARKNDKKLAEALNCASSMTTVIADGNLGAYAKNLIKLRSDWDKLLRKTAELIASNEPAFTLRYYSDIRSDAIDYNKGMMTIGISSPHLYQDNFIDWYEENLKIEEEMRTALQKIPESKDWGDKINKFPWSYANDIGGNNWLQDKNVVRSIAFDLSLLDADKKAIAKKRIRFDVGSFSVRNKRFIINNSFEEKEDLGKMTFTVSVNDADTDSLSISFAPVDANGKDVSVIPLAKEVLSPARVLEMIDAADIHAFNGKTLKIGCAPAYFHYSRHYGEYSKCGYEEIFFRDVKWLSGAVLDLSEMVSLREIADYSPLRDSNIGAIALPETIYYIGTDAFERCINLKTVTIPKSVRVIAVNAFSDYSLLKTVNYTGTKQQWKNITIAGRNKALQNAKVKYDFKGK